ncbi:SMI1/KNR4 family protein [Streptomyces sp. NPDC050803]|uniref:SMI1/KNR4 family protein n=1 Tax=unclassified Streptomyces TaxID=2593676 RepID=UPI003438AC0B
MNAVPDPLTEAEVAEAERELGVRFPAEYRTYLLRVSAGGAVSRLRRTAEGWWWDGNGDTRRDLLATAFPHPDSYDAADDALLAREPRAEDFPDADSHARAWRAWDDEAGEFEDWKTAGAMVAEEEGCGFATLLVLTGPLAGTVWWDGRATCDRIVPLSLNHLRGARPVTFGEWLTRDSWGLLPPGWG